jgi:putative effector of murein hydrolase
MDPSALPPGLGLGLLMVVAYALAHQLFVRHPSPALHPVFVSTGVAVCVLRLCRQQAEADRPVEAVALGLLGPVTVALAVPVYTQRARLRAAGLPLLVGTVTGSLVTIAAGIGIAALGRLQPAVLRALAVKSVTTSIAVELARLQGTDPALAAGFVVLTALLGAMLGPALLSRCRIADPIARGVALGSIAMGLGTAAALREDEAAGATAGLAMVGGAVVTALLVPVNVPALLCLFGA